MHPHSASSGGVRPGNIPKAPLRIPFLELSKEAEFKHSVGPVNTNNQDPQVENNNSPRKGNNNSNANNHGGKPTRLNFKPVAPSSAPPTNNNNNKNNNDDNGNDDVDNTNTNNDQEQQQQQQRQRQHQPQSARSSSSRPFMTTLDKMAVCWSNGISLPSDMLHIDFGQQRSTLTSRGTTTTNNNNNNNNPRSGLNSAASTVAARSKNVAGSRKELVAASVSSSKDPALVTALQAYISRELSMRRGEGPDSVLEVHREVLVAIGDTFKSFGGLISGAVAAYEDALVQARSFQDIAGELRAQHAYEQRRLEERIAKLEAAAHDAHTKRIVAEEEARRIDEAFAENQKESDDARARLSDDLELITDERDMDLSRMLTLIRAVKDADIRIMSLQQQNQRLKNEAEASTSLRIQVRNAEDELRKFKDLYQETVPKRMYESARMDFEKRIDLLERENQDLRRSASFRAAQVDRMARLVRQYSHQKTVALDLKKEQQQQQRLGSGVLPGSPSTSNGSQLPKNNFGSFTHNNDGHYPSEPGSIQASPVEVMLDGTIATNITKYNDDTTHQPPHRVLTPRPEWRGALKDELDLVAPDADELGIATTKGWVGHLVSRLKMFQQVVKQFDLGFPPPQQSNAGPGFFITNSSNNNNNNEEGTNNNNNNNSSGGRDSSVSSPAGAGVTTTTSNQLLPPQNNNNNNNSSRPIPSLVAANMMTINNSNAPNNNRNESRKSSFAFSPPTPSMLSVMTSGNTNNNSTLRPLSNVITSNKLSNTNSSSSGGGGAHGHHPQYQISRIIPPQKKGIYLLPLAKLQLSGFGTGSSGNNNNTASNNQQFENNNVDAPRRKTIGGGNNTELQNEQPQQQEFINSGGDLALVVPSAAVVVGSPASLASLASAAASSSSMQFNAAHQFFSFLPPYIRTLGCVRVDENNLSLSRKEALDHMFSFWEFRFKQIACPRKPGEPVPRLPLSSLLRSFARFTIDKVNGFAPLVVGGNHNNNNILLGVGGISSSTSAGYGSLSLAAEYAANFLSFVEKNKESDVRCYVFWNTLNGVLPERITLDMMQHVEDIRDEARKIMAGGGNNPTNAIPLAARERDHQQRDNETNNNHNRTPTPTTANINTNMNNNNNNNQQQQQQQQNLQRRVRKAVLMECFGPLLSHKSIPYLETLKIALGRDATLDAEELLWPSGSFSSSLFLELLVGQALDENLELYITLVESVTACSTTFESPLDEQPYVRVEDLHSCILAAEPSTPEIILQDVRRFPLKRARNRIQANQQQQLLQAQQQQRIAGGTFVPSSSQLQQFGASTTSTAAFSETPNDSYLNDQKMFLDDVLYEIAWSPIIKRAAPLVSSSSVSVGEM